MCAFFWTRNLGGGNGHDLVSSCQARRIDTSRRSRFDRMKILRPILSDRPITTAAALHRQYSVALFPYAASPVLPGEYGEFSTGDKSSSSNPACIEIVEKCNTDDSNRNRGPAALSQLFMWPMFACAAQIA